MKQNHSLKNRTLGAKSKSLKLLVLTACLGTLAAFSSANLAGLTRSVNATSTSLTVAAKTPHYHLTRSLKLGGTGFWDYLVDDAVNHHLFISHGTHVIVVDTKSWKVAGDIPNTPGVHGIAISQKDGKGFTSNGGDNTVTVFDLKSFKVLATVSVDKGPDGIVYEPTTDRIFTFDGKSSKATAIDAATNQVVGSIDLGGRPEFAAADGKGGLFNNIESTSEVVSIDPQSLKIIKRWSLAPADGPSGIAVNPDNDTIFSTCGTTMAISDGSAGKMIGSVTIDDGPDAARFDPGTGLAFASCGTGTIAVLGPDSTAPGGYKLVQTVTTQQGARTMALDAKTHKIYVVTAKFEAPKPGATGRARRGTMVADSFVLLEYSP